MHDVKPPLFLSSTTYGSRQAAFTLYAKLCTETNGKWKVKLTISTLFELQIFTGTKKIWSLFQLVQIFVVHLAPPVCSCGFSCSWPTGTPVWIKHIQSQDHQVAISTYPLLTFPTSIVRRHWHPANGTWTFPLRNLDWGCSVIDENERDVSTVSYLNTGDLQKVIAIDRTTLLCLFSLPPHL